MSTIEQQAVVPAGTWTLDPVHSGAHGQIHHHHGGREVFHEVQGFLAGGGFSHYLEVRLGAQKCPQPASDHQMIVVSDEGRSRLQRAIQGSTAYSVVRGAGTSVLDVR